MALLSVASIVGTRIGSGAVMTIISQHWKAVGIAILIGIIGYQNNFERRVFFGADTIPYYKAIVVEQKAHIDTIAEANDELSLAIERSNERVEQWQVVSENLERDNRLLQSDITNLRNITRNNVRNILNAPTPQSCEAAVDYLRDAIPSLTFDNIEDLQQ